MFGGVLRITATDTETEMKMQANGSASEAHSSLFSLTFMPPISPPPTTSFASNSHHAQHTHSHSYTHTHTHTHTPIHPPPPPPSVFSFQSHLLSHLHLAYLHHFLSLSRSSSSSHSSSHSLSLTPAHSVSLLIHLYGPSLALSLLFTHFFLSLCVHHPLSLLSHFLLLPLKLIGSLHHELVHAYLTLTERILSFLRVFVSHVHFYSSSSSSFSSFLLSLLSVLRSSRSHERTSFSSFCSHTNHLHRACVVGMHVQMTKDLVMLITTAYMWLNEWTHAAYLTPNTKRNILLSSLAPVLSLFLSFVSFFFLSIFLVCVLLGPLSFSPSARLFSLSFRSQQEDILVRSFQNLHIFAQQHPEICVAVLSVLLLVCASRVYTTRKRSFSLFFSTLLLLFFLIQTLSHSLQLHTPISIFVSLISEVRSVVSFVCSLPVCAPLASLFVCWVQFSLLPFFCYIRCGQLCMAAVVAYVTTTEAAAVGAAASSSGNSASHLGLSSLMFLDSLLHSLFAWWCFWIVSLAVTVYSSRFFERAPAEPLACKLS